MQWLLSIFGTRGISHTKKDFLGNTYKKTPKKLIRSPAWKRFGRVDLVNCTLVALEKKSSNASDSLQGQSLFLANGGKS